MPANNKPEHKPAKRRVMALVGTVLFLIGALFFFSLGQRTHTLELKAYFKNAHGLRIGAPVRLSGVEVGNVTSVRVRPERREAAAEITMRLHTPYKLHIPKDAVAEVASTGVLGQPFVEINISKAAAEPARSGDELRTAERSSLLESIFGSRGKSSQNETGVAPEKPSPKR